MRELSRRDWVLQGIGMAATVAGVSAIPKPGFAQGTGASKALRLVWPYETSSLDPVGVGVQRSTWTISLHIYDRLVRYGLKDDADGGRIYDPQRIEGELAERWEVSQDGKTLTFFIRKGATFHDGSPVTAEDVRWSIARAMTASSAVAGLMRAGGINSPDQMSAIDDSTFQLKLPEANRYSLPMFAIPYTAIMNKKLALQHAKPNDPWATEFLKTNSAGGGAFRVVSFRPEQVMLTLNDKWANGQLPVVQQMSFQTVPEATLRAAMVERGAADIAMEIPPADFQAVEQRKVAKAVAIAMPNHMEFVGVNSNAAPFNDLQLRQAVAYALPYDDIYRNIYRQRGKALYGGSGSLQGGVFPQPTVYSSDPAKAKALLAQAGKPGGFETSLIYSMAKAGYFDMVALAVKSNLEKVGIRVNIERLPGAQFDERVATRNFGMLLDNRVAWFGDPDYWMRVYYSGPGSTNLGNYQSPKLAQMLKDLPGNASPAEYATRTKEMANLVLTEVPLIPIKTGAMEIVMSRRVDGYPYWFHGYPDARFMRFA